MSARRVVAALLAMMLGTAVISVLPGSLRAFADPADGSPADSAMTLSGKGDFATLQVTVSQTKDLINQVVTVAWKGGVPTKGLFATNFLQIMQCWGDDQTNGPDRTQCQFGAAVTGDGYRHLAVRALDGYVAKADPKETLTLPAGSPPSLHPYVPFWPVGGPKPTGVATSNSNDFFDSQVTNELPLARTRFDGTGQEFFEVETTRQAAGLGCGEPVTTGATVTGRKCWLVVVPRGSTEVDGSPRNGTDNPSIGQLATSPLSQSNWDNRIVFPMEFVPVGQACPIGVPERRVVGHELATDEVGRWQPALCAGGASFNYTQLADDVARGQVLDGSSPGLALVTNPVPPDQAPSGRPLVYAPVGLSGLAIAFNIDHQVESLAPPEMQKLDGQRFLSMKLTPRLVAKLLTQSYQSAVVGRQEQHTPDYLKNNPLGLTVDPEFLTLNPEYAGFTPFNPPPDALVQLGGSDITSLLWSWVKADPDASKFLAGAPDEHGMVVNKENKDLALPKSTFPRNDQTCVDVVVGYVGGAITNPITAKKCTLDVHPFTNDMHDAGRSASRGDSQGRVPGLGADNTTAVPKKLDRAPNHANSLIAVVDAATAARYSLPTASLRNAAGQFVAPTTTGLRAGAAAMTPSAVPGVLAADPGAADPAAYPLTALSYAVTVPSTLDAAAGKDYAAFLRYAAGLGQQPGSAPGQLPLGMVPLPDALKAQTVAAAATIEAQAGKALPSSPPPQPAGSGLVPQASAGNTAGLTGGSSAATGSTATATTPAASVSSGPAAKASNGVQQPVAGVRRTPALSVPAVGALLLAILICGVLAATSSPVLHSPALRQFGATVLRRLRRGVTPTER
ncbi:MAG: hypothetical protein ACRDQY_02440 [Pseudonocardiaceae bacterium]